MTTSKLYNIILADDHILLRDALANLIDGFQEFNVIAKAANGSEVIELIESGVQPDILVMDLNMPKMDGYETAKWLVKNHPQIKIVILTMYGSDIVLIRMLQMGVSGFLKKDIHPVELKDALLKIAAGEIFYSNRSAEKIASLFKKERGRNLPIENLILNDMEIEFLKLCATEMPYTEISKIMHVNLRYINSFRQALFIKLKVHSRTELVVYAFQNGIITF
ncbi:MAG: response regulator transcription factor [Ferruginibacter sp.]|nr:response regulator transcription factor [Ferruginibacter sp.]